MEGIVVAAGVAGVLGLNTDKNYLTPLELAAIADNCLVDINTGNLQALLAQFGMDLSSATSRSVLGKAVTLARASRGDL